MAKYAYHRTDGNQRVIIDALVAIGASVYPVGRPVDLLCGFRGKNFLLEVKTARGKLEASQTAFLSAWKGQVIVVRSIDDALKAIGVG